MTFGERLVEAVKVRPNARAVEELHRLHNRLEAEARSEREHLTAAGLKWLLEMWERIVDAEKA